MLHLHHVAYFATLLCGVGVTSPEGVTVHLGGSPIADPSGLAVADFRGHALFYYRPLTSRKIYSLPTQSARTRTLIAEMADQVVEAVVKPGPG